MENLNIRATARVKLTKLDTNGNVIGVEEKEIELTREEAEKLCHLQPQE